MNHKSRHFCAVCGRALDPESSAYLLSAPHATNRMAILRWDSTLATQEGVRAACAPEHALEIVAHWMVSGRLDLTFTQPTPNRDPTGDSYPPVAQTTRLGGRSKPIGEIVINRDSVRRLLASDPEALASVLDSLLAALMLDKEAAPVKRPAPEHAASRYIAVA